MKFSPLYKCIKLDVVAAIKFKTSLLLKNVTKERKGKKIKPACNFGLQSFLRLQGYITAMHNYHEKNSQQKAAKVVLHAR